MSYSTFHRDSHLIIKHLVNRQLLPFGKTYDDVLNEPKWFEHYEVTQEQADAFRKYAVDYIRNNYKIAKRTAESEVAWFVLQYGLRIKQNSKL